jgi:putative FmdB family regulatory protein
VPTYEFRCPACDHEYEEIVGYGELAACPECGEEKPNRKVSLFKMASHRATLAESAAIEDSSPQPTATLIDCTVHGREVGMRIGKGRHIRSKGLRVSGGRAGIDNEGSFDGPDTIFE